MMTRFIVCGLICFLFATVIAPIVLMFCKKLKASQSILHYVDKHASKEGTPTMGGIIFLLAMLFSSCFFFSHNQFLALFCIVVAFSYGLLGFLDDFIKVHYRHNKGLKAYQKIVGQVGLAIIVALYVYFSGRTTISFFCWSIDIGVWVIPLIIVVLVATTNSEDRPDLL